MNYLQYMQTPAGPLTTSIPEVSPSDLELLDQNMRKALLYVPGLTSKDYSYQLQDLNSDRAADGNTLHSRIGGQYSDFSNTVTIDPNYNTVPVVVHELEHAAQDKHNDEWSWKIWNKMLYYGDKAKAANSKLAQNYYQNKLDRYEDKFKQDRWYNNRTTKKLNKLFDFNIRETGSTLREASSTDWQGKSFEDLIDTNGYYDDIMHKYYYTLADKLNKANNRHAGILNYYSLQYYKEGISLQRKDRMENRWNHLKNLVDTRVRQRHDNKYLRFFKRFNNL